MNELVSLGELSVLADLVSTTPADCTLVGVLREDAAGLLLKAGALEETRAISRLPYDDSGHLIGILIAIAGASHGSDDIGRVRSVIRRRVEFGLSLVLFLVETWKAVGEDKDLHDAREVADFLPPVEKSEAYLTIGQRTCQREDFVTAILATRGIGSESSRKDTLKKIAKVICIRFGIPYDDWLARQSGDTDGHALH
jgi:hypothetical protein